VTDSVDDIGGRTGLVRTSASSRPGCICCSGRSCSLSLLEERWKRSVDGFAISEGIGFSRRNLLRRTCWSHDDSPTTPRRLDQLVASLSAKQLVLLPLLMQSTRDGWMVVGWCRGCRCAWCCSLRRKLKKLKVGREVGKLDDNHSVLWLQFFSKVLWLSEGEASAFLRFSDSDIVSLAHSLAVGNQCGERQ
jgi:hypothetical protein